jgi:hypothetical protein
LLGQSLGPKTGKEQSIRVSAWQKVGFVMMNDLAQPMSSLQAKLAKSTVKKTGHRLLSGK